MVSRKITCKQWAIDPQNLTLFTNRTSKKDLILIFHLVIILSHASAQYCTPDNRFTEASVFSHDQIDSAINVKYGSATNYYGVTQDLLLNIYYPSASAETLPKRPLIVLMHGGLFLTGNKDNMNQACREFALRGFAAATVGYRLGWDFVPNCQSVTPSTVISSNRAIYMAIQDLHAAVRFLVNQADSYSIDTSWIFSGGVSAGAFASADMAFITPEEFAQRWPYCNDPQFGTPLGNINTSGNSLTDNFSLKGLFHNWGSIVDNDYISQSTAIPLIGFAGELDELSPIDSGFFTDCPNYELMFGTRAIYNRLNNYGACSEITVKPHAGHGIYNSTYEQGIFRIGRACCFFKSLFCDNCTSAYYTDSIPPSCSLITSTFNPISEAKLLIEPNPSRGPVTIVSQAPAGSQLKIFSIHGTLLYSCIITSKTVELDLSTLRAGMYLMVVNSDRERLILIK